eukprot:3840050-Lingulodinium_polyedra.AAC.1
MAGPGCRKPLKSCDPCEGRVLLNARDMHSVLATTPLVALDQDQQRFHGSARHRPYVDLERDATASASAATSL